MHRGSGLGIYVAGVVGATVAHLGTSTMPFQVGALMDGAGLSASAAGQFGFFLVAAMALTMLALARLARPLAALPATVSGIAVSAAALTAIYGFATHPVVLYALAAIAGIGFGLVFASFITKIADFANAERIYSVSSAGAIIVVVSVMSLLPQASFYFGALGPFPGLGIVLLCTIPFCLGYGRGGGQAQSTGPISFVRADVLALLVLWSFLTLGAGAVWTFAERIGHGLHLAPTVIGVILSASTLFGVLGSVIAAASAGHIGKLTALNIGLLGSGGACLLLGIAPDLIVYAIAVQLYWLFYMFVYSYLLGAAAAIDPSGRVGTAGGGFERFGFAIGAPLGGLIVDHFSYGALGIFSGLACVIFMPVGIPLLRRTFISASQ